MFRLLLLVLVTVVTGYDPDSNVIRNSIHEQVQRAMKGLTEKAQAGCASVDLVRLAKQLSMQQFYVEEQARLAGHSGIKVMRLRGEGTQPYHASSHSDMYTMSAIHDHSEFYNTCGMGEISVSLNGIHFKTRHNDYLMARRADEGCGYDDTVPIPFPDVPPSVLQKATTEEQIEEMKKYFEAFAKQDDSIRNYKPYFKPHLCYMQGAWTVSDPDTIQEAYTSYRHHYDAKSWEALYQGTRFDSYTGTKLNEENFAFMPSTLWEVKDDGELVFGQWNYKILCHQLEDDLPLNRLRAVDDLKTRMMFNVTYEEYQKLRAARFQVNPIDSDVWQDEPTRYGLLDKLMEQIPGPDGYGACLEDNAFGFLIKKFDAPEDDDTPLNAAYFHRWYQNEEIGAMGEKVRHRGFNDENLWVAMTTQDNVLPVRLDYCNVETDECQSFEQKWVYAIPLEIIYMTPLENWNPYQIEYKGWFDTPEAATVFSGPLGPTSRNGDNDLDLAYNGTNSETFYRTPWELFVGGEYIDDPADTPKDFVYVLNQAGTEMFKVRASGIRAILPELENVGRIRQRYPIHPLYGEGEPVWKELAALKEIVMNPKKYGHMIREDE